MLPKQIKQDLANLKKAPRWVISLLICIHLLGLIPFAIAAKARVSKSPTPPVHIFPDMDQQPKYKAQSANFLFKDGRAMRENVEGTVARGELRTNRHFYEGRDENGEFATTFPSGEQVDVPASEWFEINSSFIARGQQRFSIYCAPCHGLDGYGQGVVNIRAMRLRQGWTEAKSYHDEELRNKANGHYFNVITNGLNAMSSYASQISVRDRWAIVAYLRVLQRSQNASIDDVEASKVPELMSRKSEKK